LTLAKNVDCDLLQQHPNEEGKGIVVLENISSEISCTWEHFFRLQEHSDIHDALHQSVFHMFGESSKAPLLMIR
jgi:hypothetical protein